MNESFFRDRLKFAMEEGILLVVKYGLVLLIIVFALNYFSQISQAALNGQQAALAIRLFQSKGYLPQIDTQGNVPEKTHEKDITSNLTK